MPSDRAKIPWNKSVNKYNTIQSIYLYRAYNYKTWFTNLYNINYNYYNILLHIQILYNHNTVPYMLIVTCSSTSLNPGPPTLKRWPDSENTFAQYTASQNLIGWYVIIKQSKHALRD